MNYNEILSIIHQYPVVDCIFCGHEHMGGYTITKRLDFEVHHFTVEAALESPFEFSHGIVQVFNNRLEIIGKGNVSSKVINLSKKKN
jgi:hypothetical protein